MLTQSWWLRWLVVPIVVCSFACGDDDPGSDDGPSTEEDGSVADSGADSGGDDETPPPGENEGGTDPEPPLPEDEALPIVFVHGFAGSAQQFYSQAMRFVANGYPAERLRAYEHDGAGMAGVDFVSGLDAVVDEVREKYKKEKVFLIGHSRGTAVSSMYLSDAGRAAKIEKYVSLDGAGCNPAFTVPCVAPAQTTNMRMGQTHPLPGQKHVEVATSKEAFEIQWKHFFGRDPKVVDIVKQRAPVEISGRAVNFPANTGREGATLEWWEVDGKTGKRVGSKPLKTFTLGADGKFGPLTVDPEKYYEQVLKSPETPNEHHFYSQRFLRSSEFYRMLSGPPDSPSRMNTNSGPKHAAIVPMRMQEWTVDDALEVSTKSESGDQPVKNAITDAITNNPISVFLHDDAATPGESSLEPLPWFPTQPFQNGIDMFMPANETPDGTITLTVKPRNAPDKPQTVNVPNWASSRHTISVMFADFPQD